MASRRRVRLSTLAAIAALVCSLAGLVTEASADLVLAAAGDIACPPGRKPSFSQCEQSATARLITRAHPSAVAALGDDQYEHGGLREFIGPGAFNDTWGAFKPLIHPVPGNEEYAISPTASGYFEYFGSIAGADHLGYYSYQLGDWHLIALNSSCSDLGCSDSPRGRVSTAEVEWLGADLAQARGQCILAYWHHPLFSSTIGLRGQRGVAPLWKALFRAHADVVLNGHAHDYERFARQDPNGRLTPVGIREFVVGTGGRNHHHFTDRALKATQRRDEDDFGVLFLTLHPDRYDWQFRTTHGNVEDRGSTRCHNASRRR